MKLSVMMITYNHERFIAQALESILAQRVNFDYEIVVGEDCSTDRTRDILMDFHRRYPDRIVPLLRDQNLGIMHNFEATLGACRGRYLALLEGDDYWTSEDKLQRQTDFLDAHSDYAICCHRAQIVQETGVNEEAVFPSLPAGPYTLEDLLKGNFIMTCTVLYRRDSGGKIPGWFREMKLGDWPLMVLAARSGKIRLMDEIMAAYRMHTGGTWTSRTPSGRLQESIKMLHALDRELGFRYSDTIRRTIAGFYFDSATISRRDGKRFETAKHLLGCLCSGGWKLRGKRRSLASFAKFSLLGN